MLNNKPFYYRLLRKYVTLFGSFFDAIDIVRYASDNVTEVKRLRVPLIYGPKDHYVTRLTSDPDVLRELQTVLPRMSFEITGISYDAKRKQNSLLKSFNATSATSAAGTYMGVPYDINFDLNIYTKTVDDGNQITEQIIPYFPPDFTVTVNPIKQLGFLKDIPLILNNVSPNLQYEGNLDSIRMITWTLSFTMKVYFFGPTLTQGIIRESIVNIFNDPSIVQGNVTRMNMALPGNNGDYNPSDIVWQGGSFDTATAYGTVEYWFRSNGTLIIGATQGTFQVGSNVRAQSSNANYSISSFDTSPLRLVTIDVQPSPNTANAWDDYGYTTKITEWGTDFIK